MCHFLAELSVIIFFFTATSSLINSSKLNPNSSLIAIRLTISGIPLLVSHFVIACLDTFILSASYSCEKPACFLHSLIFSPKFIFESSLLFGKLIIMIFEFLTRNRHLQCLLQYVADIVYNYFTNEQMRFLLLSSVKFRFSISSFSDLKYFFAYFLLLSPATQLTI